MNNTFQQHSQEPSEDSTFGIIGAQELDSKGGRSWVGYLTAERLAEAWMPSADSMFLEFARRKLIDSVTEMSEQIVPRYSKGEQTSERGIRNLIESGELGKNTAVVLDSGGPHSVAMAIELMKQGYQPVVMLDGVPSSGNGNPVEQSLATLLYFAQEAEQLRSSGKFDATSPPVFIMNTHRADEPSDNHYSYSEADLPSAQLLQEQGITEVVYLNEGDQGGQIRADFQSMDRVARDLKPVVAAWIEGALEVRYTGVRPWPERKFEGLSLREAESLIQQAASYLNLGDLDLPELEFELEVDE